MWSCNNCGEEITKDKYKHCWKCGKPRAEQQQTTLNVHAPIVVKPAAVGQMPEKIEPIVEPEIAKSEVPLPIPQPHPTPATPAESTEYVSSIPEKTGSIFGFIFGKVIPVLLWLAAVGGIGYFANLSYQKSQAFDAKLAADFANFQANRAQFVFPPIPVLRRGTVLAGDLRPKVLPLNVKTGEIESLFNELPDSLRPATVDEVKTMMWLDCTNNPVTKYRDGTIGSQEKCIVYLVDRDTNKFIGIDDFSGVMPALAKERAGEDALGKVFPEKYINYLRSKQPETERDGVQNSSESPNHHFYGKSEFIYAILALGVLLAIGLGWLAFNLRFSRK